MISYIQRQLWESSIATDRDKVFAAVAIPKGGVFHGASFDIHLRQVELLVAKSVMYGITGYAVAIPDPDAAIAFDALWDSRVPKNQEGATASLDLDTEAADITPEYEPGSVDWAALYDLGLQPKRLYRRRKMITSASAGRGPAATGTMTHYLPQDRFQMNVGGGFKATQPTGVMFALSNPVLDHTTATVLTSPTEKEWIMLTYLEDTAIDALKFLIGLTEAGATVPYAEAAGFLEKTLMPDAFEETAGFFATATWEMVAFGSFTCSVPGTMRAGKLDGDK